MQTLVSYSSRLAAAACAFVLSAVLIGATVSGPAEASTPSTPSGSAYVGVVA